MMRPTPKNELDRRFGVVLRDGLLPRVAVEPRRRRGESLSSGERRPERFLIGTCEFEMMSELVDHLVSEVWSGAGHTHHCRRRTGHILGSRLEIPVCTQRQRLDARETGRMSGQELVPGLRCQRPQVARHRLVEAEARRPSIEGERNRGSGGHENNDPNSNSQHHSRLPADANAGLGDGTRHNGEPGTRSES